MWCVCVEECGSGVCVERVRDADVCGESEVVEM